MIATAYGNVYVAQIAMGADMPQTVKALAEAEAHRGPSLVIAYSHCIAHGIDMSTAMSHQKEAVDSGYWPLYRFDPRNEEAGEHALRLDSKKPSIPLKVFTSKEARYAMLARSDPERAERLSREAQDDVDARRHLYEQLAGVERGVAHDETPRPQDPEPALKEEGPQDDRPSHPLSGSGPREPDRAVGLAARPADRHAPAPPGRRRGRRRPPSLFEEQIEHEEMQIHGVLEAGADSFAEAPSYLPAFEDYNTGSDAYLRHLEATKKELEIPVIASLNGISLGGWTKHARRMQDAGADALELNVYFIAADPDETGAVEERYIDLVEAVRAEITIPLAVKIGPFFSSVGHMARRLVDAGADGLVLFNRFMQPDIDLDTLRVDPTLTLSSSDELRLPLRWIAILHGRIQASLAATTGVHTSADALKMLLAGADVVMMASALLHDGPEHVAVVLREIEAWMDEREYTSVEQLEAR